MQARAVSVNQIRASSRRLLRLGGWWMRASLKIYVGPDL